jgi:DNA-binding response OmpR family regulator
MSNIKNLKQLKILIVEDESSIAQLLYEAVADYFMECRMATNGHEAIISYDLYEYDIIITDINMPYMDGLEMTKKLKLINPDLPIIILSAHSDTQRLLEAIDLGVVKYFIKPFDPDELLDYLIKISSKLININSIKLKNGFIYNFQTKQLYLNDEIVKLSSREQKFIDILLEKKDDILHEDEMKKLIWEEEDVNKERIRTFVKRVRQKTSKELIKNVPTRGYHIVLA